MRIFIAIVVAFAVISFAHAEAPLTPPMGWMSWEIFRCQTDCETYPNDCINAQLYEQMTDHLANDGYLDAGYDTIHLDDCWMEKTPPRTADGRLAADKERFPKGMKDLGDYMHNNKVKFGLYTAESPTTCAGYPASANHEEIDAETFASWGVDYLKVDGCGYGSYYADGYKAMGAALLNQSREIIYSCSWPAYLGPDEYKKPYFDMINIGCNLWRNYADIQCSWGSLKSIIEHWGTYGAVLQSIAGIGHFNDPDMLLIGNPCISDDEARTQMALWSILAAPLIMGNDLRNITDSTKAILLNKMAIKVNQDPLGMQGIRLSTQGTIEIWGRLLADQSYAIGLVNMNDTSAQDITLPFSLLSMQNTVQVTDIWAQSAPVNYTTSYTAKSVPVHGTAFVIVKEYENPQVEEFSNPKKPWTFN